MKVSQYLVRTLREAPSSAELQSHIHLLRGGYIKQLAAGLYSIMPMGKRVLEKIETIIREEMNRAGGQEIDLPLIHPAELWKESGRYQAIGDELLRFKDRTGHDMVLAMTHEEAVTDLMRSVISSYKQLPCMVYQFKLKFRDEPRARGGLIRVREFVMKDAYSFHETENDLDAFYDKMYEAYHQIFRRVGIKPIAVQSDTGIMGGKAAHEFMLEADSGEDYLILSEDTTYTANQEIALFERESSPETPLEMEKIATPDQKSIEEVSRFLKISENNTLKSVIYHTGKKTIIVCIRGDLNVGETKVRNFLKAPALLPAEASDMEKSGLVPGFASPIGLKAGPELVILVDTSIAEGNNFVAGANESGFHLKNVNFPRDFQSSIVGDFAQAEEGHKCISSNSRLRAVRGIEIGNIFKLGTKFSKSMKAEFLDEKGQRRPMVMGCYGIGIGRLMAAVVENSHDKFGPIWPTAIAPFQVHLLNIGAEPEVMASCEKLYLDLTAKGFEVLFDDRDERPGVKFKDADLWGCPVRLGISPKTLDENSCEWKIREEKEVQMVRLSDASDRLGSFFTEKHSGK